MKTKLLLLSLMLALLLPGCGQRTTAGPDELLVSLTLETEQSLSEVSYSYRVNGRLLGSGGCSNADGSPLRSGDTLTIDFLPEDFPEGADRTVLSLSVTTEDGKTRDAGTLSIPVSYGTVYPVTISGSAAGGYTAAGQELAQD